MSWLRIDDGFDSHPKMLELSELQRWRWTRVLIHCARHDTRGSVTPSLLRELGLARAIPRLLSSGLLEQTDTPGYVVHDWSIYNGQTIEEKVAAYLDAYPDASANAICRAIGGKRELVLAVVAQFRNGSPNGSISVPDPVPGNHLGRYPNGSRARAPVPSPQEPPPVLPSEVQDQPNGRTAGRTDEIEAQLLDPAPILAAVPTADDNIPWSIP